ncbi:hypothetical protein CHS0354_038023 [Potamilus streckersoni]|uniref:Uncharacterized protein n=1 Tax=Potamilus streckersoni TaxID=2493646 RepID=A0AAE0SRL5_9BIVA|nr:hypothetical protein CHS0354_038023 [Potamilus streckersoni]
MLKKGVFSDIFLDPCGVAEFTEAINQKNQTIALSRILPLPGINSTWKTLRTCALKKNNTFLFIALSIEGLNEDSA